MFDYNSARLTTRLRDRKSKHMIKSNSATVAQLDEGNLFLIIITYNLKTLMSILDAPSILDQSLKSEGEQTKVPAESNMLNVQIEDSNPHEYQEYFSSKLLLLILLETGRNTKKRMHRSYGRIKLKPSKNS